MATILKISDGENILEAMPLDNNECFDIWMGDEEDSQSWRCVSLDKEDAKNLIRYIQEQLNYLK